MKQAFRITAVALASMLNTAHAQTPQAQTPQAQTPQAQTPQAQSWPQRTVRIITPLPVGSGADLAARLFAERLAERWGKPVVVENRPGGDNIVGVMAFVGARDGHTLLFSLGGPITVNPLNQDTLPYDPARDLVPISPGVETFVAVAAPASLNIDRLVDFVALARTQPGKLNWGAQPGPLDYVVPGFLQSAGLDMVRVSYRDLGPVLQDLSEGRIHFYAAAHATLTPLLQAGKAKALAVTNRRRSPNAPEVPTAAETGFPVLEMDPFLGFFGPRDMPDELRERVAADIRAAGADPTLAARLASTGQTVRTGTPAEFATTIEEQRAKMAGIARMLGVRPRQ